MTRDKNHTFIEMETPTELICCRDAEAFASSDASASCYSFSKDVFVVTVIVAELELGQIQRKVFLADMVIAANDAALQETPEVLDIIRVDLATDVLACRMRCGVVFVTQCLQIVIAVVLIRSDQINLVAYCLADKPIKRSRIGILDNLADHVALAGDSSDHRGLAAQARNMLTLIPMAVLVFPADSSFVYFDNAHQLSELSILHSRTEPMAQIPSRRVGRSDLPLNLLCADSLLSVEHAPENFKPSAERIVGILENRARNDGKPITRLAAFLALPVPWTMGQFPDLFVPATRASNNAIRPAAILQELFARILVRESNHQFA